MHRARTPLVVALALVAAVAIPLAASLRDAPREVAAQAPTTPFPTTPCTGCGPTGGGPNAGLRAFAYPEHFCSNDPNAPAGQFPPNSAVYGLVYGLGKNAPGPATFYALLTPHDHPGAHQLATLNPGESTIEFPIAIVPQGSEVQMTVWAVLADGTTRVVFGNGTDSTQDTLTCDCIPTAVTPPTTPPTTPALGIGSTTPPIVNTVPPGSFPFPPSL